MDAGEFESMAMALRIITNEMLKLTDEGRIRVLASVAILMVEPTALIERIECQTGTRATGRKR